MIISRKNLRNMILFGILSYLGCFGSLLFADAQKKKVPSYKQEPPKPDRIIPYRVYGQVKRISGRSRSVKNFRLILKHIPGSLKRSKGVSTQMSVVDSKKKSSQSETPELNKKGSNRRIRQVRIPPKICKPDEYGRYSFSIDPKYKGHKFKLEAWHLMFPKGGFIRYKLYKRDRRKTKPEFILDRNIKVDVIFWPPELRLCIFVTPAEFDPAYFHDPAKPGIINAVIELSKEVSQLKYKRIGLKIAGDGRWLFLLDVDDYKKKFRVRVNHPQRYSFGADMFPKEEVFTVDSYFHNSPFGSYTRCILFRYRGPLPDLALTQVKVSWNCIVAYVENIGELKAGPFQVSFKYKYESTYESEREIRIIKKDFPFLEVKGKIRVPVTFDKKFIFDKAVVNPDPHTTNERNYRNNSKNLAKAIKLRRSGCD